MSSNYVLGVCLGECLRTMSLTHVVEGLETVTVKEPATAAAAKETADKETAAKETAAKETAAKETAAEETAAEETAAKETAAEETVPRNVPYVPRNSPRKRRRNDAHVQILNLAERHNLPELLNLADAAYKRMDSIATPPEGWDHYVPSWLGSDDERGLGAWGSRNYKSKNIDRPWSEESVCRHTINKAVSKYVALIGLWPVRTGVRPKKKIKTKGRGGHGHTKAQKVLREACDGEPEVNLFRVFGIVVHAGYCHHLNPPVPAGSTAADAVMWMLHKPNVKRQLLKSVRTCLI